MKTYVFYLFIEYSSLEMKPLVWFSHLMVLYSTSYNVKSIYYLFLNVSLGKSSFYVWSWQFSLVYEDCHTFLTLTGVFNYAWTEVNLRFYLLETLSQRDLPKKGLGVNRWQERRRTLYRGCGGSLVGRQGARASQGLDRSPLPVFPRALSFWEISCIEYFTRNVSTRKYARDKTNIQAWFGRGWF